jgi:hypothetical protein
MPDQIRIKLELNLLQTRTNLVQILWQSFTKQIHPSEHLRNTSGIPSMLWANW